MKQTSTRKSPSCEIANTKIFPEKLFKKIINGKLCNAAKVLSTLSSVRDIMNTLSSTNDNVSVKSFDGFF